MMIFDVFKNESLGCARSFATQRSPADGYQRFEATLKMEELIVSMLKVEVLPPKLWLTTCMTERCLKAEDHNPYFTSCLK
jgi:hypothetical protein